MMEVLKRTFHDLDLNRLCWLIAAEMFASGADGSLDGDGFVQVGRVLGMDELTHRDEDAPKDDEFAHHARILA